MMLRVQINALLFITRGVRNGWVVSILDCEPGSLSNGYLLITTFSIEIIALNFGQSYILIIPIDISKAFTLKGKMDYHNVQI